MPSSRLLQNKAPPRLNWQTPDPCRRAINIVINIRYEQKLHISENYLNTVPNIPQHSIDSVILPKLVASKLQLSRFTTGTARVCCWLFPVFQAATLQLWVSKAVTEKWLIGAMAGEKKCFYQSSWWYRRFLSTESAQAGRQSSSLCEQLRCRFQMWTGCIVDAHRSLELVSLDCWSWLRSIRKESKFDLGPVIIGWHSACSWRLSKHGSRSEW